MKKYNHNQLLKIYPLRLRWNLGQNECMDDKQWPMKMAIQNDHWKWPMTNDQWLWPIIMINACDQWPMKMINDYDRVTMTMTDDQRWCLKTTVSKYCPKTQSQSKTIRKALGQWKILEKHWAEELLLEKPWAGGTPINCTLGQRNRLVLILAGSLCNLCQFLWYVSTSHRLHTVPLFFEYGLRFLPLCYYVLCYNYLPCSQHSQHTITKKLLLIYHTVAFAAWE